MNKIDRSLLTNQPCGPPCWQGLSPRKSNIQEVLSTLGTLPFVKPSSMKVEESQIENTTQVKWTSEFLDWPDPIGTISLDDNKIVKTILLRLEYRLSLQEMFSILGDPQRVLVVPMTIDTPPTCYRVILFWPQYGLSVHLPTLPKGGVVSSTIPVEEVTYYMPASTVEEYFEANGAPESYAEDLLPWQGLSAIQLP